MLTGPTALLVFLGAALFFASRLGRMPEESVARKPWMTFPLALLLIFSFVARLNRLNEGLWLDEIGTWVRFMRMPLLEIPTVYNSENQHFLFSMLARISLFVFGESAWAFRLPAVVFGVAAIWAMYLFGREVASEREGYASALLLAFSYHHVWFSQNARGYSGMLFWALLSSYLMVRGMREKRMSLWIAYGFCAALGAYTQATMVFLLVTQGVAGIVYAIRNSQWRGPMAGLGLGALLSGVLHIPAFPMILPSLQRTNSVVVEWKQPMWTVQEFVIGLAAQFGGGLVFAAGVIAFAVGLVFLAGLVSFARVAPIVCVLLIVPAVFGTAVFLATNHHVWPRFYFFGFGFAAIIMVRGIVRTCEWLAARFGHPNMGTEFASLALVLAVLVSAAGMQRAFGPKQDFEGAYQFINASVQPGEKIVTVSLAGYVYHQFYKTDWTAVEAEAHLKQLMQGKGTWLVFTLEPVFRSEQPRLYKFVKENFDVVRTFHGSLQNGDVVVCHYAGPSAKSGDASQ